ncbi:MAG: hypothetical protein BWY07_01008 [Candidatus Hydrogenedentes bacterium ADurb.Bin170]|nr:MAG: hypothetical protein BWY07_01008 [Candidatus Hydrogenedentes bacterium ADurb.Bin170]
MIENKNRFEEILIILLISLYFFAFSAPAMAESMSIPPEAVDDQRIFWGTASSFEKPGSVDYNAVVSATTEYKEAVKAEKNTAQYWLFISKANDRAIRAISSVGSETDFDLIVLKGYLEGLTPPIATEDITELALAKLSK